MALPRLAPLVGGATLDGGAREWAVVTNPYTNEPIAEVAVGTEADLEAAIAAAQAAFRNTRAMSRHARREVLARAAERITAERGALAAEITAACGKPISQALGEVDRAALTFSFAADEARRFGGEVVPLDVDPRAAQMTGLVHRFPVGPISAISPFNFPLNLLAHKVAPAIAVGSAVVVKPPPQCPQLAFRLGTLLGECGLPPGAYNVLHLPLPLAERLATDPRFALLTFTGSPAVGWRLKSIAGRKKVVLELGGNAGVVVHDDAPDLDRLAQRLALGAFAYAGQVCIKVQRVLVHERIYDEFARKFVDAAAALAVGDPMDPGTAIGPVIDQAAADRVEAWVEEAIADGATPLLRGHRAGTVLGPTVLAGASRTAKVSCREVFGPVATLAPYTEWRSALDEVNDSPFGLQAGVFTRDIGRIFEAFHILEVGGVIANDFPTLRIDNFPYGGVKESGFGREGVKYAMEEMSEPRMLVLNLGRS